jgi:hypothetical protein
MSQLLNFHCRYWSDDCPVSVRFLPDLAVFGFCSSQNRVVRIVVNCMSSTSVSVALRALNMCSWDVRSPSHSSRNASPDPGLSEDSIARVSQMARGISRTNSIAGGHGVLWTLCRDAPSLRRLIREGVQRIATQHWHPSVRKCVLDSVNHV